MPRKTPPTASKETRNIKLKSISFKRLTSPKKPIRELKAAPDNKLKGLKMNSEMVTIKLPLSAAVHQKLESEAAALGMKFNAYVQFILGQHVNQKEAKAV